MVNREPTRVDHRECGSVDPRSRGFFKMNKTLSLPMLLDQWALPAVSARRGSADLRRWQTVETPHDSGNRFTQHRIQAKFQGHRRRSAFGIVLAERILRH